MTSEGMNVFSQVQKSLTIEMNLTLDANVRRILTVSTDGKVNGLGRKEGRKVSFNTASAILALFEPNQMP